MKPSHEQNKTPEQQVDGFIEGASIFVSLGDNEFNVEKLKRELAQHQGIHSVREMKTELDGVQTLEIIFGDEKKGWLVKEHFVAIRKDAAGKERRTPTARIALKFSEDYANYKPGDYADEIPVP